MQPIKCNKCGKKKSAERMANDPGPAICHDCAKSELHPIFKNILNTIIFREEDESI